MWVSSLFRVDLPVLGSGFFEFVNEPREGLLKGPTLFGKGLAKGVAGLLNGVGGALDSVSTISGTLYNLVQSLIFLDIIII